MDEGPDPRIENAIVAVASVGALFAAFAFVLFRVATGISVTAGAVVATLNLYALGKIIAAFTGEKAGSAFWKVLGVSKIFLLFGGVWLLLSKGLVDPIPFVVGLGSLPIGLSIGSMLPSRRGR